MSQLCVRCTRNHDGAWVFPLSAVIFVKVLIPAPSGCVVAAVVISGHGQDEVCRYLFRHTELKKGFCASVCPLLLSLLVALIKDVTSSTDSVLCCFKGN